MQSRSRFNMFMIAAAVMYLSYTARCIGQGPTTVQTEEIMSILYEYDLGRARTVSQVFDASGRYLIVAIAMPDNTLTVQTVDVNTMSAKVTFYEDNVAGCSVARAVVGNQIGILLSKTLGVPTFDAVIFELQQDQFSRIHRRWRSPDQSIPVGWVSGETKFTVLYSVRGRKGCTLESFGTSVALSSEGHVEADPFTTELIAASGRFGLVILLKGDTVAIYEKASAESLVLVQEIESVEEAAASPDGQILVIQDKLGVHVCELALGRDKSHYVKRRTIAASHDRDLSLKVSRTGRFIVLSDQASCELVDMWECGSVREYVCASGVDWAVSDDGTKIGVVCRTQPSDSNVRLRVMGALSKNIDASGNRERDELRTP